MQLQCKQVQLQYVQSNAARDDAVASDATAGGHQSRSQNQHLPTHTTASRCQSKCGFFNVSFLNSDGTKHTSTGATQVQHQCKASSMATPMQTQVHARCKHKSNTSANAMATTCRDMQTRIHPMQTQVQTQVQPQQQSADASASAIIGAMHEQATRVPQLFPITNPPP